MAGMSNTEYWQEVHSIVDSLIEEREPDDTEDDLQERLWEDVDGHEWVIYTGYHYEILQHTDNDSYYVDNFGADGLTDGGHLRTELLAFGALYADCMDYFSRQEVDYDEEEDPEPEESARLLCDPAYTPRVAS